jgi:hypothetical protein
LSVTASGLRIEIDFSEIPAGDDGGIRQCLKRYRLEMDIGGIPGGHVQRRAELPAVWQLQTDIERNLTREISSGIKCGRVPIQPQHFRSDGRPTL